MRSLSEEFVVGVDGCKAGWVAIAIDARGNFGHSVERSFTALVDSYHGASLILVDIPIGLPDGSEERACDKWARKYLGKPRSSSVFPVPCRDALSAANPTAVNERTTGRKLTLQTLAILEKIREVDAFLRSDDNRNRVRETHPEVCFWALNGKRAMRHHKSSSQGITERETILRRAFPASREVVRELLAAHPRRALGHDDILDALAAAVTARRKVQTLPTHPPRDRNGLAMEITYSIDEPTSRRSGDEDRRRIAILGWGSLVWDPRDLPLVPPWRPGGPALPLEFSRISSDGRLTLVIDPTDGESLPTRFALSPRGALEDVVADLRDREGTTWMNIGMIGLSSRQERSRFPALLGTLKDWLGRNGLDAVVWTDLQPNFERQLSRKFTIDLALEYLRGLPRGVAERAREYIEKAPSEVRTPLRRRLHEIGWPDGLP
jgi:predicted RNase H-like nuclease